MSRATVLAEAIKDKLNGDTFSLSVEAVRSYRAIYSLKELKELHITVVAPSIDQKAVSRNSNTDEIVIAVVVQQQCSLTDNDKLDSLSDLLEEIGDQFRGVSFNNATWFATNISIPYDPDDLSERRVFTGVIHLRYQISWYKE